MILGGRGYDTAQVELYNPETEKFELSPTLLFSKKNKEYRSLTATPLANGQILILGNNIGKLSDPTSEAFPNSKIKLKNLEKKIDAAKDHIAEKNSPNIKPSQLGQVMKLAVEIVAAMAIGLGIGLILDNYFSTRPLFTIIFFLLGSLAGILNVFRVAKSMQNN